MYVGSAFAFTRKLFVFQVVPATKAFLVRKKAGEAALPPQPGPSGSPKVSFQQKI
jgi:hypothetical protein